MGRRKLKINRLEKASGRQLTYSKRRVGITTKAKELSILCDIDILLLLFSPNGKPTLCLGEHSNIEDIVTKFSQLSPQEREDRKLKSLQALKKTFKKLDHDVNIQDFMDSSSQTVEELTSQSQTLQAQIAKIKWKLSCWTNPENVHDIDHIRKMEEILTESLNRIQIHKAYLWKQLMSLDCSGQWLHGSDRPHFMLSEDASLLPLRNLEQSAGTALHGYPGYFSTDNPECSKRGPEEALNELSQNSCLPLQLGAHDPYQCYDMNFLGENTFNPDGEINIQESHVDYQLNCYQPPSYGHDAGNQTWASSSGIHGIVIVDEHHYAQQPNQTERSYK